MIDQICGWATACLPYEVVEYPLAPQVLSLTRLAATVWAKTANHRAEWAHKPPVTRGTASVDWALPSKIRSTEIGILLRAHHLAGPVTYHSAQSIPSHPFTSLILTLSASRFSLYSLPMNVPLV